MKQKLTFTRTLPETPSITATVIINDANIDEIEKAGRSLFIGSGRLWDHLAQKLELQDLTSSHVIHEYTYTLEPLGAKKP